MKKTILLIFIAILSISAFSQSRTLLRDTLTGTDVTSIRIWIADYAGNDWRQKGFRFEDRLIEIAITPTSHDTTIKSYYPRWNVNDTIYAFGQWWYYDKIFDWVYKEHVPDGSVILEEVNRQMIIQNPIIRYLY